MMTVFVDSVFVDSVFVASDIGGLVQLGDYGWDVFGDLPDIVDDARPEYESEVDAIRLGTGGKCRP